MLARTYLSAEALQISESQKAALIKVLGALERDELSPVQLFFDERDEQTIYPENGFNMGRWGDEDDMVGLGCGTVCCIGGWAEKFDGRPIFSGGVDGEFDVWPAELDELFYPGAYSGFEYDYATITVAQAIRALSNFLTVGQPFWETILTPAGEGEGLG